MPKKRAASSKSSLPTKKKATSKKKSQVPATTKSDVKSTKKTARKTSNKSSTTRVAQPRLTRNDVPSELIEQIASEVRAELRSEIDSKVQLAIAREREYLASISIPCRYRPTEVDSEQFYDGRKKVPNKEQYEKPRIRFVNEIPEEYLRVEEERKRRWKQLKPQYDRGIELMEKYGKKIMNTPGVTGLHVGFKRVNDKIIHPLQYSLRISVRRKRDKTDPRIFKKLPSRIDGYPTDVLEREFESLGDSVSADRPRRASSMAGSDLKPFNSNPSAILKGGIVISASQTPNNWGTLGVILEQKGNRYGITCAHVAKKGDIVKHPSSGKEIGQSMFDSTGGENSTQQDLSLILLNPEVESSKNSIIEFGSLRYSPTINLDGQDAQEYNIAFKIGAASDPKQIVLGRVQATNAEVLISGKPKMSNQIIVEQYENTPLPLVSPGDSGSILLAKTTDSSIVNVIGLVHARTEDGSIVASPWTGVEQAFNKFTSG